MEYIVVLRTIYILYDVNLGTVPYCVLLLHIYGSVVDPYSFFPDPDPDPEFDVGDQYGSRALMTKN